MSATQEEITTTAFLLSREWYDADRGVDIILWGRSASAPVRARFTRQESVMFVPRGAEARGARRAERPLATMRGEPVDAIYFDSQRAMLRERDRIRAELGVTLESDVKPHERFLMERFITGAFELRGKARERDGVLCFENPAITTTDAQPTLTLLALDLETDGFDGPLLSAALATRDVGRVFVIGSGKDRGVITFVPDERALLTAFFRSIREIDPDVLCGWNVVEFDLLVLEARCREHRVPFGIGRARENARVLAGTTTQQVSIARVPGRAVLDGIATLKSATHRFERFTLDHVAHELLGRGKKIASGVDPVAEIRRMHAEDVDALAAYNLEDCKLTLDIFEKADLLGFAMERARLTGLALDRQGGSVAAFDHLYLPRLHRRGFVAPDVGTDVDMIASPGGYVLDSVPGLYRDVLSFDFRSLYPSIIRTFQIDPLGLFQPGASPIPGEDGATFAREGAILPALISTLHEARSRAISAKNEPLSRAIKIVMNSFYGVLGTPGCRFFDSRLPTSITRRGHLVIERAQAFFTERGLPVIYGDTDSLFVHFANAEARTPGGSLADQGKALAAELTQTLARELREELDVESVLELRFESHYLRYLMPTTRGTERGSKKRYAGLVRKDGGLEVVVRGLEAVRTDWTPLARRVQRELLRRVFSDEPYESWLEEIARDVVGGRLDAELVYRKRLRQKLDQYSNASAPPHVRAARMRVEEGQDEREIEYVMTTRGPEPTSERKSPIDHAHYIERQLAPVCDVVLHLLGTSFDRLAGNQRSLF